MNIIISAAKTGGHVYPAIEVGQELKSRGCKIFFIGTGSQIELNALKDSGFEFIALNIDGFRGKSIFSKAASIKNTFISIFKIIRIIKKNDIKGIIGFGGFITVPVGLAGYLMRIKVFTHEQNSVMGSANKLLSKFAFINFLGLPTNDDVKNSIESGNPIRPSFQKNKEVLQSNDKDIVKIYITGGSQGSSYLNETLPLCLSEFKNKIKIKHQCGKGNLKEVEGLYSKTSLNYHVAEFYKDPSHEIDWADFVISRSGALTISEVSSSSKGSLMIPLPISIDNHQLINAQHITNINMGCIHNERDGPESLKKILREIIDKKIYIEWQENKNSQHINASKVISRNILKEYETI